MEVSEVIDEFEAMLLANFDKVNCPVEHSFAPGMYIRKIFMQKGMVVTSLIHNTIHPYFVLKGKLSVVSENDGVQEIEAPYNGITYPGTRRILQIHEDTIWITVHSTDIKPKDATPESINEAVDLICGEIIHTHENYFLGGVLKNNEVKQILETKTESPLIEQ